MYRRLPSSKPLVCSNLLASLLLFALLFLSLTPATSFILPIPTPNRNLHLLKPHRLQSQSSSSSSFSPPNPTTPTPPSRITYSSTHTGGNPLHIQSLTVHLPTSKTPLLSDLSFTLPTSHKFALIGKNGCGKSTLLNCITGERDFDSGTVYVNNGVRVGYLQQKGVGGSRLTVEEECAIGMIEMNKCKLELEEITRRVENGDTTPETLTLLAKTEETFRLSGGYDQEKLVAQILKGLGFKTKDSQRLCSEFSGGWNMRIALAKLLLSNPSLLILDEPSNHLDAAARSWLAQYLSTYSGTLLMVSHDVPLMSKSCDSIAEIENGTLNIYKSMTYSQHLLEKAKRWQNLNAEYERNKSEADRLQKFVDRFGASTRSSAAQSKSKVIERMRREGKLDVPPPVAITPIENDNNSANELSSNNSRRITFPNPPSAGSEYLLKLTNCSISYPSIPFPLLNSVTLTITPGMRLLIRGVNGAGKSTLLNAIRGKDASVVLRRGTRDVSKGVKQNVFEQDLAQDLDPTKTAVQTVTDTVRRDDLTITDEAVRGVFGQLGLESHVQMNKVGSLSGGEKARVALASFVMRTANLLIFDEPSNHLDHTTITSLAHGIKTWESGKRDKKGAVVVVSHDRAFCEMLEVTHVVTVEGGRVKMEERGLRDSDWVVEEELGGGSSGGNGSNSKSGSDSGGKGGKEKERRAVMTNEERKRAFNQEKKMKKKNEAMTVG